MTGLGIMRPALAAIVLCAVAAVAAPALAQTSGKTWTEPPYNPPVGSAWSVLSKTDSEENRPGGERITAQIVSRTEFTVDEKLPGGYRVSYVTRDIKMTGNAPGRQIVEMAFSSMKDIVIRGRVDAAGKPVAVDNLDEVKTSMRAVIASMAQAFDKNPKLADFVRQMMSGLLNVEGPQAAPVYMEDLATLAAGQGTGLAPGTVKRADEPISTPLGGAINSTLETRLESFDGAAGTARYIRKRKFDPASMKAVTLALSEKLAAAADNKVLTPEVLKQMKDIAFEIESESVISVEGGMTRNIDDRSFTSARLMGQVMSKTEKKTITVTPLK